MIRKAQLVSLIRMLSTPVDGERLGAVAAIERLLVSSGLTWHDLADVVEGSSLDVDRDQNTQEWIDAASAILRNPGLSQMERQFVEEMQGKFVLNDRLGCDWQPSQKQTAWFVRLYRKKVQSVEAMQ